MTLFLAGGVAVGIVPQAGGTSVAQVQPVATAQDVTATTTPGTAAPTTVAPEAAPPPDTTPATTPAPVAAAAEEEEVTYYEEEPAAVEAAAPEPTGPIGVERLVPSSAQVKAAIAQIGGGLPISEAQARQFGNTVCSAFDAGQSAAQIKAAALQEASKVPFVRVSSGQVDAAVRTAVQLFCPGYSGQV